MRLYFMRGGHIAAVEVLDGIKDDHIAIGLGSKRFLMRIAEGFEGFEVWERDRMVFQYPGDDDNRAGPASGGNGTKDNGPPGGSQGMALPRSTLRPAATGSAAAPQLSA